MGVGNGHDPSTAHASVAAGDSLAADAAGAATPSLSRREALSLIAVAAGAAAFRVTPAQAADAASAAHLALGEQAASGAAFAPKFFTAHEWKTVRALVDLIIPRDERSGSATDAGVPEFMDFVMTDQPNSQTQMRGGLHWMDAQCERRFRTSFVACTRAQQTSLLDEIAWPKKAKPDVSQGAAFFSYVRDMTASGFFSSKMGVADLRYMGNRVVHEWNGCPPEALAKLGVHY
ncbi:MAG: gluconate 2-dehydrogenase subunit 3 family protein [Gemmatimonadaceae bacterium]